MSLFLSFQIIPIISLLIVLVGLLLGTRQEPSGLYLIVLYGITPLVFFTSLDLYFWCVVKKVYNDTKNNRDMLLTEIEHEGIELHCHTIWQGTTDFLCTIVYLLSVNKLSAPKVMLVHLIFIKFSNESNISWNTE